MVEAFVPKNLEECLLRLNHNDYEIVAGGTDALIQNRSHTSMPIGFKKPVIYLSLLEDLKYIRQIDNRIHIGANISLESILESEITPKILKDIIIEMASPAIRHTATLAGNICNASPAGDSLVGLYLLDALLEVQSYQNKRYVLLKDFITGVRRIDLLKNEMITEIIIPNLDFTDCYFRKVGPRLSDAISKLSFAGAYKLEANIIKDIRLAFGAVNTTVVRNKEIEKKYINKLVSDLKNNVENLVKLYEPFIKPIDDQRSNKEYRKEICFNLIREFVDKI